MDWQWFGHKDPELLSGIVADDDEVELSIVIKEDFF